MRFQISPAALRFIRGESRRHSYRHETASDAVIKLAVLLMFRRHGLAIVTVYEIVTILRHWDRARVELAIEQMKNEFGWLINKGRGIRLSARARKMLEKARSKYGNYTVKSNDSLPEDIQTCVDDNERPA